ncbi:hypothetical protein [Microvirga sp. VF16]|uniref:hypothetical protein n=1 Tax=Microvirga sp. VF16 TaxID=2807101 RepID=UPI00193CD713|nr:hypothetical protein [Microvirga sp. VF16]QRM34762.1 hypothetical protein JO965_41605 [Microvirga sp. VF16]
MHTIPQFQPQYSIINRAQEVWTYDTLEDAVLALNKAALQQGFFLSEVLADRFSYETRVDIDGIRRDTLIGHLIVRSSLGDVLTRDQILDLAHKLRARPARPQGTYRNGPWPGIRRPRGHRGSSIRIVRTKQAMTWHDADKEDLLAAGIPPGRIMRQRELPTYWSDVSRSNQRSRKSQRKHQWR